MKNNLEEIFWREGKFSDDNRLFKSNETKPEPIGSPIIVSVESIKENEFAEEDNLKKEIWNKSVLLDFLKGSNAYVKGNFIYSGLNRKYKSYSIQYYKI